MVRPTGAVRTLVVLGAMPTMGLGDDTAQEHQLCSRVNETTVREVGTKYVAAFNKQDAAALAAFWSPEAVYTNRLTGEQVTGGKRLRNNYKAVCRRRCTQAEMWRRFDRLSFLPTWLSRKAWRRSSLIRTAERSLLCRVREA